MNPAIQKKFDLQALKQLVQQPQNFAEAQTFSRGESILRKPPLCSCNLSYATMVFPLYKVMTRAMKYIQEPLLPLLTPT